MARFLLDSADINEFKKWKPFIDGITTNPSLLEKAGTTAQELYGSLVKAKANENYKMFVQVADLPVHRNLIHKSAVGPQVIYKVPLVLEQYNYLKDLKEFGLQTCGTMTYDVIQLQTALNFDVDYCIILLHKNEIHTMPYNAEEMRGATKKHTKLIGASFRTKDEVIEAILLGMDYVTVPPNVLEMCFYNEQAKEDYDKLYI